MVSFARSMGVAGQAHVSAGDLEDEERIRLEDADEEEDNESATGSDDTELELADGLKGILARDEDEEASRSSFADDDDDDDDDTSEDEEETPKSSFQARLERMRSHAVGRPIKDMVREEPVQDGEFDDDQNSNSDPDEDDEDDIMARIESFLDENDDILRAKGRKQRNVVFRAIQSGTFEVEFDGSIDASPKRKKDKHKHIPAELHDQWERDRAKKAERKHLRELERLAAASADFFTPTKKKKKGKKARKARQAAAAAISLETVAEHMRAFVLDIGGAPMLALPPMEKRTRKLVHDLATAFNLKSKSEGNGKARFTTLTRTTMSGVRVDERKIARILGKPDGGGGKSKGKAPGGKIRPRDGEVVGGAAPKIDGSNLGFQMLAGMGWQEGTRIGAVGGHGGGLDAPLLAVIKTTKLGLGASSHRG